MSEYTPPTEAIRERFSRIPLGEGMSIEAYDRVRRVEGENRAAFDRWLAGRDAEMRADGGVKLIDSILETGGGVSADQLRALRDRIAVRAAREGDQR